MEFLLSTSLILCLKIFLIFSKVQATTFTFVNKCGETVWPGILSNAGNSQLGTTGFELPASTSRAFQAPTGWSGRFWARTACTATSPNGWLCATGDCGTGKLECNGATAAPPATLAEFTLASSSAGKDFYDVSLVDGYNLPIMVTPSGGAAGTCAAAGCVADLNPRCPAELRIGSGDGLACRSACEAFGKPEYCCSGAYANPNTCKPTVYSQMFKAACPKSYSYAFDDPTSIFTCGGGADYTITFCPASMPSTHKSSTDAQPTSSIPATTSTPATSTSTTGGVMLEDDSWLASLATGESNAFTLSAHLFKVAATTIACYFLLILI